MIDMEATIEKIQDLTALKDRAGARELLNGASAPEVGEKEVTEDFQRPAAVTPHRASCRDSGLWSLFSRRVGWLAVLVQVNLASGGVIAFNEELFATSIALTFFIPPLVATGGHAGAQSATLMVRTMATDDVRPGQYAWSLGREVVVGLAVYFPIASLVLKRAIPCSCGA